MSDPIVHWSEITTCLDLLDNVTITFTIGPEAEYGVRKEVFTQRRNNWMGSKEERKAVRVSEVFTLELNWTEAKITFKSYVLRKEIF